MSAANDQQRGQYTQASSALQWHELGFPREMKSEALLSFVRTLSTRPRSGPFTPCRSLICEVLATGQPTGLRWTLGIDRSEVAAVLGHLRASLPSLHLTRLSGRALPKLQSGMEVRLNPPFRPVRSDDPAGVSRGLLTAMQAVSGKEVLLLSWTIGGWLPRSANPPSSPDASIGLGSADPARAQREATAMRKAKQTEPLWCQRAHRSQCGYCWSSSATSPRCFRCPPARSAAWGWPCSPSNLTTSDCPAAAYPAASVGLLALPAQCCRTNCPARLAAR